MTEPLLIASMIVWSERCADSGHGGVEDVVALVRADEVVLAEAAWPDGARRRTASPFSNVTTPETAHWLMMAVGRDDIQAGYKLKLQTLRYSREWNIHVCSNLAEPDISATCKLQHRLDKSKPTKVPIEFD